jgi:hypothetical protein
MVQMVVRIDALQRTTASLAGRVSRIELATQGHTDMAASIHRQFDELHNIMRGLHGHPRWRGGWATLWWVDAPNGLHLGE